MSTIAKNLFHTRRKKREKKTFLVFLRIRFCSREFNLATTATDEAMFERGVIGDISEVREWTLPDFFSIEDEFIRSPRFSLAGCTWFLEVHPNGSDDSEEHMSVFLSKVDSEIPEKELTYALGLKKADGSLEEKRLRNHTFKKSCLAYGWYDFFQLDELRERKSELAPSDAVTFTCRVVMEAPDPEEVVPNAEEKDSKSPETMLEGLETLSSDLKDILITRRNCDVTLIVEEKEFKAHKAILSARCNVLGAMFDHDTSESRSGVVRIPDCDYESFGDFLEFLYTGKAGNMSFATAHHLYVTADKYNVKQLKELCISCMSQNMTVENILEIIVLAELYNDEVLKSSSQAFFRKNWQRVLLTSEWTELLLKKDPRLANKLLQELATALKCT